LSVSSTNEEATATLTEQGKGATLITFMLFFLSRSANHTRHSSSMNGKGTTTEEQEQPSVAISTQETSAYDSLVDQSLSVVEVVKKEEEVPETTTYNRSADIENSFKFIFADQEISQTREDALVWIIQTDPKQVGVDYPTLLQRYILALIYFATKGEEWTDAYKWLSEDNECQWSHVMCDDSLQVIGLDFRNNNLQGEIPHEMSFLEILQTLDMSNNNLTGAIPDEFGNFYFLEQLHLYGNEFDTGLPDEICYLKSEHLKDLRIDCDLECTCCDECGPP